MTAQNLEAMVFQQPSLDNDTQCEALSGVTLSDDELTRAAAAYEAFRDSHDGAVKVGLYGDDLRRAIQDVGSTILRYYNDDQEVGEVYAPLLVPTANLEWYNLPYLHEKYGSDTELYTYVHPPTPENPLAKAVVAAAIKEVLDTGAVILLDEYSGDSAFDDEHWQSDEPEGQSGARVVTLQNGEQQYEMEIIGSGGKQKKTDVFVGTIEFGEQRQVVKAPSFYDAYAEAVSKGDLVIDKQNGPALEQTLTEEEVQKIWEIYKKPFDRLSKGNPFLAGFGEEDLRFMLDNPDVIKVVNRKDGEITTVGLFAQDFELCPWFNKAYFEREYPDYYKTGNILFCPAIVSDETKRASAHSWSLVDLVAKVGAMRGADLLLSFECTEISTRYIPSKVVVRGVEASGVATAEGFASPTSIVEYKAVKKL